MGLYPEDDPSTCLPPLMFLICEVASGYEFLYIHIHEDGALESNIEIETDDDVRPSVAAGKLQATTGPGRKENHNLEEKITGDTNTNTNTTINTTQTTTLVATTAPTPLAIYGTKEAYG